MRLFGFSFIYGKGEIAEAGTERFQNFVNYLLEVSHLHVLYQDWQYLAVVLLPVMGYP